MKPLITSCGYGFDCKVMTGFDSNSCPNLSQCAQGRPRSEPRPQRAPYSELPYYFETHQSMRVLVVSQHLPLKAQSAGWMSAQRLFYEYETATSTLFVALHLWRVPDHAHFIGWCKPENLPYTFDGYLKVLYPTQAQREHGWDAALLLPYSISEDCLIVSTSYCCDAASSAGWESPVDLDATFESLIIDNCCPDCGNIKNINSAIFGAFAWYECRNCLWHGGFRISHLLRICNGFICETGVRRALIDDGCCPDCGDFTLAHYQDDDTACFECQSCLWGGCFYL